MSAPVFNAMFNPNKVNKTNGFLWNSKTRTLGQIMVFKFYKILEVFKNINIVFHIFILLKYLI